MRRQDVTYQDKINELRLDISHPNSEGLAFILVEGDSDIRLFRKFFNLDNCKVESVPGGNPKVEDAVTELLNKSKLVIGIRDADFIHLNSATYTNKNVFLTDLHDIEMSLVAEDEVFSSIVFEFTNLPKAEHNNTRAEIISFIEQISLLKWLNEQENLELHFKEVGFQDLLSFSGEGFDFRTYFNRLIAKSLNTNVDNFEAIVEKMTNLKLRRPNVYQLCNGHDFMKAFASFLKQKGREKSVSENAISSLFRTNYRQEFYQKTNLFKKTNKWSETVNCSIYLQ